MTSPRVVAIVDYGMGNIFSLRRLVDRVGFKSVVVRDPDAIVKSEYLILPGVGGFSHAASEIDALGIAPAIIESAQLGCNILGICLGMQLLCTRSDEGAGDGLNLISATFRRFPDVESYPIPQTQWNLVNSSNSRLLSGDSDGEFFYFVHSYYLPISAVDEGLVVHKSKYCGFEYVSGFEHKNIAGVQYHPELSGVAGERLMKNFLKIR